LLRLYLREQPQQNEHDTFSISTIEEDFIMLKTSVYSPTQVAIGSFIGGPLATVFFLGKNFACLHNRTGLQKTCIYGTAFIALLFIILPLLPDSFPNYAIPAAYIIAARKIVEKYQLSKTAIAQSSDYSFQSNAKVFLISLGFLIAFLVLMVGWIMGLAQMGIIKL
jgi:hypothetical protein